MSRFCETHHLPRAGVDPIDTANVALSMIDTVITRPLRAETIALLLDEHHRGRSVVVVDGTHEPDALLAVLDVIVESGGDAIGALVVASVRPTAGVGVDDVDRWLEASELCAAGRIELLEWFVVLGDGVECPRDLLGEPPRWPS